MRAAMAPLPNVLSPQEPTPIPNARSLASGKSSRRAFDAEYKYKILEEVARTSGRGGIRAILVREALKTSHISKWRTVARTASLKALAGSALAARSGPVESAALRHVVVLQGRLLRYLIGTLDRAVLDAIAHDIAELQRATATAGLTSMGEVFPSRQGGRIARPNERPRQSR